MKIINKLMYDLQISYVDNFGLDVFIDIKTQDDGLEFKTFKVGDVCVTEETINGRVLSGRIDCQGSFCGYRYNYDKGADEYLVTLNPEISLNDSVDLINNAKKDKSFLGARMVLSSIAKDDYRIFSLQQGDLKVSKTVSAENEKAKECVFKEELSLFKPEGEESFVKKTSEQIFQIDGKTDESFKSEMKELIEIFKQNPNGYKALLAAKASVQPLPETPSI